MIFSLDTDNTNKIKLIFSALEYEKDLADVIADFCYRLASFFVDFAMKLDCDMEQAHGLKGVFTSGIGRNIDNILEHSILDPDEEANERRKEQTLYDKMCGIYAE